MISRVPVNGYLWSMILIRIPALSESPSQEKSNQEEAFQYRALRQALNSHYHDLDGQFFLFDSKNTLKKPS
ncbi:MAG: hypothetical protein DRI65_12505 [Chloroflexota bacterium]|nr:MAG: hypothetical protein DRI65_12505 [Chloroflexota bacterium]